MAYVQTAEFELASEEYIDIQSTSGAATTYSEGELADFNDCVGFLIADVAVSSKFAAVIQCNKVNALKAAEAMTAGQRLYWDNSNSYVTVTQPSSGSSAIGYVLNDAVSGDNTVTMTFDGRGVFSLTA